MTQEMTFRIRRGVGRRHACQAIPEHRRRVDQAKLARLGWPGLVDTSACACRRLCEYLTRSGGAAVFVHIPKTAGSSIEHAFGVRGSCHATATELRRCNSSAYDAAPASFATLRHPLTRALSLFSHTCKAGNARRQPLRDTEDVAGEQRRWGWLRGVRGFSDFMEELVRRNVQPQRLDSGLFVSQARMVTDRSGALHVRELLCVDSDSDGEQTLLQGLARLQQREPRLPFLRRGATRTPQPIALPHRRVSAPHSRPTEAQVDPRARELVRRLWGADFALYEAHCGVSTNTSSKNMVFSS